MQKDQKVKEAVELIEQMANLGKPKYGTNEYAELNRLKSQFNQKFKEVEGCFCGGRSAIISKAFSAASSGDLSNAKSLLSGAFRTVGLDIKKALFK